MPLRPPAKTNLQYIPFSIAGMLGVSLELTFTRERVICFWQKRCHLSFLFLKKSRYVLSRQVRRAFIDGGHCSTQITWGNVLRNSSLLTAPVTVHPSSPIPSSLCLFPEMNKMLSLGERREAEAVALKCQTRASLLAKDTGSSSLWACRRMPSPLPFYLIFSSHWQRHSISSFYSIISPFIGIVF